MKVCFFPLQVTLAFSNWWCSAHFSLVQPQVYGLREGQISGQFSDSVLPAHLLELHSAVLEPNLDLPVSEVYALTDL